jgi:hypothetical protein
MASLQPRNFLPRTRRQWIAWIFLGLLLTVAITVNIAVSHAEPILRQRVIDTLSDRFKSRVELAAFHVSVIHGLEVSGSGLHIYGDQDSNVHQIGVQPLIGLAEFRFHTGLLDLFRTPMHVDTVYVKGLQLNIPSKKDRGQMANLGPKSRKLKMHVSRFICDGTQLLINTSTPGKLPLDFDISALTLTDIGPDQPMHFEARLTNPKPIGLINSRGEFGPWREDSPRDTPVKGAYAFSNADLGSIKGIGGILASSGQYAGTLDNIVVDGTTDTPDFRISISGHEVPLKTEFHAIVDGTSGDTYLQPVNAVVGNTALVARGSVVKTASPQGHSVQLDVAIDRGRIEDLLKLGVRTDPPIMTGHVGLKVKFLLPPGDPDVADRLKLAGNFQIVGAHFSNEKIQQKIDALSLRSQGKPKQAADSVPDNVKPDLGGVFNLGGGRLYFSSIKFTVPGTKVQLSGKYSLDGNEFDFHGKARMDAKLSHMVTGWKSVLLKPIDPFFSKHGAGTELPIKITGTRSEPHFGLDFGHDSKDDSAKD